MRFLLVAVILTSPSMAAAPAIASDPQAWLDSGASIRLAPKLSANLTAIARFGDAAGGLYETEFGGGLGYDLGNGWTAAVGYVRVPGYRDGHATHVEDRPSEQVGFRLFRLGGASIGGRVRLEQRLRDDGNGTGWRLRPQIKLLLPLHPGSPIALVASHESFIQLNHTDWGQLAGYSRMRNTIGLRTTLLPHVAIEADYINQHDFGLHDARDTTANVGVLGLSIAL